MKKNKRKFILLTNKGLAVPSVAAIEAVKVREFPLQLSFFYTLLQAKSSYNEFTFIVRTYQGSSLQSHCRVSETVAVAA